MVQLVDSRGFQLVPDIAGGLLGGIQAGQKIRGQFTQQGETEAEIARQNQFRQLSGIVADPSRPPEQRLQAQQQLAAVDPERQQKMIQERLSTMSAKETSYMKSVVMGAAKLNSIPSVEGKIQFLENRKKELIRDGITDHTDTDNVLNALKSGDETRAQEIIDKGIELGQITGILKGDIGADGESISEVQSAKILADGTVQFIRKDGTVEIVPANEANAAIIEKAQRFGAEIQGIRAGEREEAKTASGIVKESFKSLGNIRKNMTNLDRGIKLLSEGAETGAIAKFLPSVRAASIKLDQLQGELGLDIIGAVTFGALSESELLFAKDVALPKGLNEPELKEWLTNKKTAQQKVASNLDEAIRFLGVPGNTVADFISLKQPEKAQTAQEAQPQQQAQAQPQAAQQQQAAPKFLGFE